MITDEKPPSWIDHAVMKSFPQFNVEMLLVIIILVVAVISRFYDLGARVMSHDETNHVVPSYSLYQGKGYQYDPITHGPLQFHLIALSYFILGDSDFSSRVPAALFSIGTIALVLFGFRRYLSRVGALIAGFLFLVSPYMLFYGRYARDEALYVLFTVFILWSLLCYLKTGEKKYLYCLSVGMALNFVTMESAYIYTAQALLFTAFLFIEQISRKRWYRHDYQVNFIYAFGLTIILAFVSLAGLVLGENPIATPNGTTVATATRGLSFLSTLTPVAKIIVPLSLAGLLVFGIATIYFLVKGAGLALIRNERSFDLLVLSFVLVLPLLTAFPVKIFGFDPLDYSSTGALRTAAFLVPLTIIAVVIGWWWNWRQFLKNAALFYVIFTVFYTTFFTYGAGFFVGIVGALGYWLAQQAVQRGSQPWYYYAFIQIPIYEYLPAIGALLAAIIGIRHRLWVTAPEKPFERAYLQPEIIESSEDGLDEDMKLDQVEDLDEDIEEIVKEENIELTQTDTLPKSTELRPARR